MKKFFAIVIAALAFSASAQTMNDSSYEESGYSKFGLCMEATMLASQAYTLKQAKVKLEYPLFDDMLVAIFMKQAIDTGYNAKSRKQAAEQANYKCVNNKLWAAIKGFDE
jgi:hypothetical protein